MERLAAVLEQYTIVWPGNVESEGLSTDLDLVLRHEIDEPALTQPA